MAHIVTAAEIATPEPPEAVTEGGLSSGTVFRDLAHRERHRRRTNDNQRASQKLLVEFVGTFVLVFTVATATAEGGAGSLAPFAIGLALMVTVFAGGHISGAHYNPAVTLAVLIRRRISPAEASLYIVSQLIAATLAGLLARSLTGPRVLTPVSNTWKMLVVEALFTFVLAYVVLNVAVAKDTEGNSFYGLAIGLTITTGALAVGHISGGAFNPAVALGASIDGSFAWSHLWIYLVSDCAGAAVAAGLLWYLLPPNGETPLLPTRSLGSSTPATTVPAATADPASHQSHD